MDLLAYRENVYRPRSELRLMLKHIKL